MTTKMMNALVGMMVGALIIGVINELSPTLTEILQQSKLIAINRKIDRILKHHNSQRFIMIKTKRSCKTTH
jgi:hypothetical protein